MIVKIKPVPREEFGGNRQEHFLFECDEVEISLIRCNNFDEANEMGTKEGCLTTRGIVEKDDAPTVLQLWLNFQNDKCKEVYLVGRGTVFVMNNDGKTVDKFSN